MDRRSSWQLRGCHLGRIKFKKEAEWGLLKRETEVKSRASMGRKQCNMFEETEDFKNHSGNKKNKLNE